MLDRAKEAAEGDQGFYKWLVEADKKVENCVGMSLFDLDDMEIFAYYEAGSSPQEFIEEEVIERICDSFGEEMRILFM